MGRNKNRGVTLIELIVAMTVIAITVVVTLEFYRFCMRQFILNARFSLEATDFARETMEELYFSSAAGMSDGTVQELLPPCDLEGGARNSTITSNPGAGYKLIRTTVTWTS